MNNTKKSYQHVTNEDTNNYHNDDQESISKSYM